MQKTIPILALLLLPACSAEFDLQSLYQIAHSDPRPVPPGAFLSPHQVYGIVECAGLTGADPRRAQDVFDDLIRELCIRPGMPELLADAR